MASPRQLKFILMNGAPVELPNKGEVATTVRLGQKWQLAGTGELVELWVCNYPHDGTCPVVVEAGGVEGAACNSPGSARVLGWWSGAFNVIPPRLLAIEHSPNARTREGLANEMRSAYGEAFTEDAEVTVLIFERL